MIKENYYLESIKEIESLPEGKKPSLLIHVCCGPCAAFPMTFLCPHFNVTIFYDNSNIYPQEEYEKRLGELRRLLALLKKDYGYDIALVVPPYDHEGYMEDIRPYADTPEGGKRCLVCYEKRMAKGYQYAEEHGFDYFTTVMTISRQKNSQVLNSLGKELSRLHPKTKYFYSDFKKNKGQDYAREMRIRYDLYNQNYCGCEYSLAEAKIREERKASEPKNPDTKN